jgi:hypothetical protein
MRGWGQQKIEKAGEVGHMIWVYSRMPNALDRFEFGKYFERANLGRRTHMVWSDMGVGKGRN